MFPPTSPVDYFLGDEHAGCIDVRQDGLDEVLQHPFIPGECIDGKNACGIQALFLPYPKKGHTFPFARRKIVAQLNRVMTDTGFASTQKLQALLCVICLLQADLMNAS